VIQLSRSSSDIQLGLGFAFGKSFALMITGFLTADYADFADELSDGDLRRRILFRPALSEVEWAASLLRPAACRTFELRSEWTMSQHAMACQSQISRI
jgi:hypothetical protein